MNAMRKNLLTAILTMGLIVASSGAQAIVYNDFTVDPDMDPTTNTGTKDNFVADKVTGNYTETASFSVTSFTDAQNFSGTFTTDILWVAGQFVANDGVTPLPGGFGGTGLGVDYQLYALITDLTGTFKTVNGVTTLTFAIDPNTLLEVYVDYGGDTTFGFASVTGGNGTDVLVASGTTVTGEGTLDPSLSTCTAQTLNCGSFGSTFTFTLTDPEGKDFFILPDPFYNLSFQAGQFNNFNPASTAPQEINGSMDVTFGNSVPEPTSIALMGFGLMGLGFNRRKKA